jgi:hypothetical protein
MHAQISQISKHNIYMHIHLCIKPGILVPDDGP